MSDLKGLIAAVGGAIVTAVAILLVIALFVNPDGDLAEGLMAWFVKRAVYAAIITALGGGLIATLIVGAARLGGGD